MSSSGATALELTDVEIVYQRKHRSPVRAVAGASISVKPGQIVGLVGESGCGKSTLARAAVGLVAPSAGTVRFEGEPVKPLGRRSRPASLTALQMVFQDPQSSLNPRRTVGSQLADALEIVGRTLVSATGRESPSCWNRSACRPRPASGTRTSSAADSGSASPSPGRWPRIRR